MAKIFVNAPHYRFVYDAHVSAICEADPSQDGQLDALDFNAELSKIPLLSVIMGTTDPLDVIADLQKRAEQVALRSDVQSAPITAANIVIVLEPHDAEAIPIISHLIPDYRQRFIEFLKQAPYHFVLDPFPGMGGDEVLFDPKTVFIESAVATLSPPPSVAHAASETEEIAIEENPDPSAYFPRASDSWPRMGLDDLCNDLTCKYGGSPYHLPRY